ncbi:MAG: hypothetical protein ABH842_02490 [Candidatus Micrarchaeota archaeon]
MTDPRQALKDRLEAAKLRAAKPPEKVADPLKPGVLGAGLTEGPAAEPKAPVVERDAKLPSEAADVQEETPALEGDSVDQEPTLHGPGLAPEDDLASLVTRDHQDGQGTDEVVEVLAEIEPEDRGRSFDDLDVGALVSVDSGDGYSDLGPSDEVRDAFSDLPRPPPSDFDLDSDPFGDLGTPFEVPEPDATGIPDGLDALADRPAGPRDTVERPAFLEREPEREMPAMDDGPDTERQIPVVQEPEAKPDFEAMVAAALDRVLPDLKKQLKAEAVEEVTGEVARTIRRELRGIVDPFMAELRKTVDGIFDVIEGPEPAEGEKTDHGLAGRVAQLEQDLDRALGTNAESANGVRQFTLQIVSNLLIGALSADKSRRPAREDTNTVTTIASQYGAETVKGVLESFTEDPGSVKAVIAREAGVSLTDLDKPENAKLKEEVTQIAETVRAKASEMLVLVQWDSVNSGGA